MKKLKIRWLYIGLIALVALLSYANFLKKQITVATGENPYVWPDESVSLSSTMTVYEGGYAQYRCEKDTSLSCYGPLQAFVDAATLKLLPKKWIEAHPILETPGIRWPGIAKYPNSIRALRLTRVFYAFLLVLILFLYTFYFNRSLGFLSMACLVAAPAFASSWQGYKNDYVSCLWIIGFLISANQMFKAEETKKRFYYLLVALVICLLGVFVRPILLPAIPLFLFSYIVLELLDRQKIFPLVMKVAVAGFFLIIVYLVMNPNFFVSASEAFYFRRHLAGPTNHRSFIEHFQEFKLGARNLWPSVLLIWTLILFIKQYGLSKTLKRWAFFIILLSGWVWKTIVSANGYEAYYMPYLVTILIVLVMVIKELKVEPKKLIPVFATGVWIFSLNMRLPSHHDIEALLSPAHPGHWDVFLKDEKVENGDRLFVDVSLRPNITVDHPAATHIEFFDSLSENPSSLAKRIGNKKAKVFVGCWEKKTSESNLYSSFAAEDWAELTADLCPQKTPISEVAFFPFIQGFRNKVFARVDDLTKRIMKSPEWRQAFYTPKVLQGNEWILDNWYGPFIMKPDKVIHGEFILPQGSTVFELPLRSYCRDDSAVKVILESNGKKIESLKSLNTTDQYCANKAKICKQMPGLKYWSHASYELVPIRIPLRLKANTLVRLSIETQSNGTTRNCPAILSEVKFK